MKNANKELWYLFLCISTVCLTIFAVSAEKHWHERQIAYGEGLSDGAVKAAIIASDLCKRMDDKPKDCVFLRDELEKKGL
jgi:hypothetical protein